MEALEKCLEGFAAQTLAQDQFELILGGPRLPGVEHRRAMQLVFLDTGATDVSMVRSVAIDRARAPLITLYSAELRPFPELLERCLEFHRKHSAVRDACLLRFDADPRYRRLHPSSPPSATGVQSWQAFRSDAVSCKAELFRHGRFDPGYGCQAGSEFALRLSRRIDLTLFFDTVSTGERMEPMSMRAACEAHYMAAWFEYRLARAYPGAVVHTPANPLADPVELGAMVATIRGMERNPAEAASPRSAMLDALCARIEEHARAEGWAAAANAQPPNPPGSLGSLLK